MSTQTTAEPLTVDDYRATPEGTRYQLVEGDLYLTAPAPSLFHQDIAGNIFILLKTHADAHRLGHVFIAPVDVYLDDNNVAQPDVLFVTTANAGRLATDGVHGAPDLVVEVLSPATAQLDKTSKRRVYARAGVKEMWLVDPTLRQIHLYDFAKHATKAVALIEEDESFGSALLPGLTIQGAEVFKH